MCNSQSIAAEYLVVRGPTSTILTRWCILTLKYIAYGYVSGKTLAMVSVYLLKRYHLRSTCQ